jgi:hypothetical protein
MRATILLVLALVSSAGLAVPGLLSAQAQGNTLRDAVLLGRTHDDALFAAFNKGYSLSPSGSVEHAEIITEFRRGVLVVRDRALQGSYAFGPDDLAKALEPHTGTIGFIVQARLPLHPLIKEPAYDLHISTGPRSPPLASKTVKREPVHPPGAAPGSAVVAVRLEATFPRAGIERAAAPVLIVTDEKAEVLWQARIDLSRYR